MVKAISTARNIHKNKHPCMTVQVEMTDQYEQKAAACTFNGMNVDTADELDY